jgi:hypothetical protein
MSIIDAELPAEHDYNFLQSFGKAFETLNPGSIARIFTTEVNNEECFDGFCLCFKPQIVRIVRACIRAFTLDACFIKHEQNKLKGWALYTARTSSADAFSTTPGLPLPMPSSADAFSKASAHAHAYVPNRSAESDLKNPVIWQ